MRDQATIGSNHDIAKITLSAVGEVYNKKICDSLMDRVNAAEAVTKALKRRQTENEQNFRNKEYYNSFIRFIEIMKRIKNFIIDVSNLNRYQKFVHSGSVKDRFDSLTNDFDEVMTESHFTIAVANEEQRMIDQFALESDIADMTKFLEKIGGGIIDQNQKINIVLHEVSLLKEKLDHSDSDQNIKAKKIKSTELNDPLKSKPTDHLQNSDPKEAAKIQGHLAILGKLHESPYIIKFYGLSKIENSDVMVLDWAEYGSLKELYSKYDIEWHVKVPIALAICRGLTFLHSCEILHHDIRCAHILMDANLTPKIAKFNYSRMASGPTSDMKG
ncbi:10002_t:CDS:2, partial [Diversispora eburnea]